MKTSHRKSKENRDKALYNEYMQLTAVPGHMKTAVESALMKKYKIYSRSTVWAIIKRVQSRNAQTA